MEEYPKNFSLFDFNSPSENFASCVFLDAGGVFEKNWGSLYAVKVDFYARNKVVSDTTINQKQWKNTNLDLHGKS